MADEAPPTDLLTCDAEPIHIPGSIQPHGALLALRPGSYAVEQAAGDLPGLLGLSVPEALGQPAEALLGEANLRLLLDNIRAAEATSRSLPAFQALVSPAGRAFSAFAYETDGIPVIELEPSLPVDAGEVVRQLQAMQREMMGSLAPSELSERAAMSVRAVTGFDRVMLYRFLPDGSGVVEAEAREASVESFLGLHYPASDIPTQARAMYLRRWLRLIPDARYTPAPLTPRINPSSGKPLDMEQGMLRSVSPIHLEYLANMGVAASMSVSIVVNGQLWGLIACHHQTPRHVAPHVRMVCEFFAELLSLRLASEGFLERRQGQQAAARTVDQLMQGLLREPDLGKGLTGLNPNLLDLVPASGASLWFAGRAESVGKTPTPAQIATLVAWLEQRAERILITDRLPELHPPAGEYAALASGLLAVSLSKERGAYVLWYLPEFAQSITWGGDPKKAVTSGPLGVRLTPRGSFEAWREQVHHRSRPWEADEIEAATALRMSLLDVVLRQMTLAAAEREKAGRQQDLLMAELDHRVKNMLATIQAVARQSSAGETSLEGFQARFESRLQAMSRAHNVLTRSRWEKVDLRTLVQEELGPYQADGSARVTIRATTEVALRPKAALAFCLALHELATNAAKYGSLSVPDGRVDIHWEVTAPPHSELRLGWRETGGPPVRKPTRTGFGLKLITTSLAYEIDGSVDMQFPPEGVTCAIAIPLEEVMLPEGTAPTPPPANGSAARRQGLSESRILVVEDNAMIAMEVVDALDAMGATVLGPVGRLAAGLRLVEAEPMDAALLDIDLNGTKVWPLAELLASKGIPFCFASGFDPALVIPPHFADRAMLNKPYTLAKLEATLGELLKGTRQG